MNTYLLYCRFQQMRGGFSDVEYRREIAGVRELLAGFEEPHWREYLGAWPEEAAAPVAPPAAAPAPALVAATSPGLEAVSLAAVSVSVSVLDVASEIGSAAVPQAGPADSPSTREQG
jgi:hypothetical protein